MEDIKPENGCGIPGIKELRIVKVEEVAEMQVTALSTVSVTLKTGCVWGKIKGTKMSAVSTAGKSHANKITAHVAGWPEYAGDLAKGRYVAAWVDGHGQHRMCGFSEPLRMTVERTEPEEPSGSYGADITLENESEFGFLNLAQ
jgi:hypothetical protein